MTKNLPNLMKNLNLQIQEFNRLQEGEVQTDPYLHMS